MNSGLTFWNHEAGTSKPPNWRSVSWLAKIDSDEPACSKPDQNSAAPTKRTASTIIRRFSAPVRSPAR